MNTPTMDSKGSNHRPQPLDGSPRLARPHRLARLVALALGSLSMLIAIPGTASAQTVQRISNCLAVTTNEGDKTFTNNCGYVLSVKGTREATGPGCQALTTTSLGKDNNNNTLTYASYSTVNGRICFSYPNQQERYLSGGYKTCDDVSSPDLSACPQSGGLREISPPTIPSGHIKLDNDNGSDSKTVSLTEGQSSTVAVKPSAAPDSSADLVVNISSADTTSVTVSPASLTFTSGNWNTAQNFTITAAGDTDLDDETVAVTLSPAFTSGLYVGNRTITVNTDDLNQSIITNPTSGGGIAEDSGATTIKVTLEADPGAGGITVSAVASGSVSITPPSLGFTSDNYDTGKNFSLAPVPDTDGTDGTGTVTFTAPGVDEAKVLTYSVTDGDGGITVSSAAVTAVEGGTDGTFTVTLAAPPASSAVLSVTSSNTSIATVSPATLTFSDSDSTTAQNVTVTGAEDNDGTDDTATITLAVTSGYNASDATKSITVQDDDGAILLSSADVDAIEGGTTGTFTVTLDAPPASSTTLTIESQDTSLATVTPATMTFSTANYDDAQTVTVTGKEDSDGTDDTVTIELEVSSAGGYRADDVSKDVDVLDNDGSIKIDEQDADDADTLLVGEQSSDTFDVTLGAAPDFEANVSVVSSDDLVATVSPTSLRFTDTNWSTAQTVTVTGAEDRDYIDEDVEIRLNVSDLTEYRINYDGDYSDDNDVTVRSVTVDDNDMPPEGQLVIRRPADVGILEGGGGSVWGISLSSNDPDDPIIFDSTVSLAVSGSDSGAVTVSPATLTFVAMSPSKEQLVTISPVDDSDYEDESAVIEVSVNEDGGVNAPTKEIPITVIDDDSPPSGTIVLDDTGLMRLDEGSSGTFTVKLGGTVPTYAVNVSLDSSDTGAVKVSPPTMTFISSDSKREKTATVTAINDSDYDNESVSITLTSTGGLSTPSVTKLVEVRDDDIEPKLIISEERLSLGENQSTTINVRLNQETPLPVNVSITTSSSDIGVNPSSFSFEPSQWNTPVPISVYVFADSNQRDDFGIITFTAATGKIGSVFENLVQELPIEMTEVTVPGRPSPTLSIQSYALAIPPPSAQDQANVRIWCRHSEPCTVSLECSAQEDGMFMEGQLPQPIPSMGTVTLSATEIAEIIGGSWEGKGRLGCALLSDGDLLAQVWTRSGDGVLINNSATLRSVDNRVDIHDIPSPDSSDVSNIRIRCPTEYPGDCKNVNLRCHDNEGMPYTGFLGTIKRGAVFHMQTADLSEIIVRKWKGSELYCQVSASRPFTVQVLTRTGGGGALVNNSASGSGLM
ncbi:MAG: hypothetical protein ISN28_15875 [Ectothiorhodospiraceae bacterium AqS1]|nr:hypothetical protein [Ectothiorhodospiraceae bacterium AqS1]